MKKLFFLVVIFFSLGKTCLAIPSNEIKKIRNFYAVCDENNKRHVTYLIEYKSRYSFFLNLSNNYNFNFEDYYPISFEESPFPSDIQYFSGTDIIDYDSFYVSSLQRILWERLYPDKTLKFCDYENKESYYQDIKSKIYDIYEGPDFTFKTVYQSEGVEYEYTFPYLEYFKIVSSEGVNAQIEGSKLKVSGDKGRYQIILKRNVKIDGFTENLFTDGTNYLMVYPKVIDKDYILDVVIGSKEVILNVKDENGTFLDNVCFMIDDEKYCSDEKGKIKYTTDLDFLEIKLVDNDIYKTYEQMVPADKEQDIILSKKEVIIEEDIIDNNLPKDVIEVIPSEENNNEEKYVIIEVKDTYFLSKKIFLLLVIILAIYVFI